MSVGWTGATRAATPASTTTGSAARPGSDGGRGGDTSQDRGPATDVDAAPGDDHEDQCGDGEQQHAEAEQQTLNLTWGHAFPLRRARVPQAGHVSGSGESSAAQSGHLLGSRRAAGYMALFLCR